VQIAQATRAHPQLSEAQLSSRLTSDGLAYIKAHPAYVLEVVGLSAVRMLGLPGPALERYEARFVAYDESLAVLSVYAFWVVGLLALIAVARRLARGVPWAFWGVPAVIFLAGCLFSGTQRYRAPADPFLLILGALALRHLTTAPRAGRRRRRALPSPSA
jgi:hypothetical protein